MPMSDDTRDLARLIHAECQAVNDDFMTRLISGRDLTPLAFREVRRRLSYAVEKIDAMAQANEWEAIQKDIAKEKK